MEIITRHIIVKGKVQGVFFRKYTRQKAIELNITGWVRNNSDGFVEITAQGNGENITRFIEWCRNGPPAAKVDEVATKEISTEIFIDFVIMR